jgi:hypothetical protein
VAASGYKQSYEPLEHYKCIDQSLVWVIERARESTYRVKPEPCPESYRPNIARRNKIELHR